MEFYCFMCDYYVALIFALVLLKCGNLRVTVCGLKIDWGSRPGCSYLRTAYYVITFCFTQVFVDSAYKQLTMALSQAPNLLRPNNVSTDLTDHFVNNFIYFFE